MYRVQPSKNQAPKPINMLRKRSFHIGVANRREPVVWHRHELSARADYVQNGEGRSLSLSVPPRR